VNLQNLLEHIDTKWRKDFIQFVDTGEANADFLKYLNNDKRAQEAVENAFTAHVAALQGLAEELNAPAGAVEAARDKVSSASNELAQAVTGVLNLAPDQREKVVRDAAAKLVSQPQRQKEVAAIADAFKQNVADTAKW
jgi:hypothetical protein